MNIRRKKAYEYLFAFNYYHNCAGQQRRTQPVLRHLLLPWRLETDQDIPKSRGSCYLRHYPLLRYDFLLVPLHLEYLETIVFILVIACLVQIVEMFLKKTSPAIYNALGIYLPLITTNCAVLGVALTNVQDGYNFIQSVTAGFGTAIGYTISIVLLAGIRDRIDEASVPRPFRGAPVVLLSAALMSIAFMGFAGLSL